MGHFQRDVVAIKQWCSDRVRSDPTITPVYGNLPIEEVTEITIEMLDGGVLGVELSPHGLKFNRPVKMTTDLRGTSAEGLTNVSTLWFNEDLGLWETVDEFDTGCTYLIGASLLHFSKYADNIIG